MSWKYKLRPASLFCENRLQGKNHDKLILGLDKKNEAAGIGVGFFSFFPPPPPGAVNCNAETSRIPPLALGATYLILQFFFAAELWE